MVDLQIERALPAIELRPTVLRAGDRVQVAFRASRVDGAMRLPRYEVTVVDARRRRIATLLRGHARPAGGVICVDWDGRDDRGAAVPSGDYRLRVQRIGGTLRIEHTLTVVY